MEENSRSLKIQIEEQMEENSRNLKVQIGDLKEKLGSNLEVYKGHVSEQIMTLEDEVSDIRQQVAALQASGMNSATKFFIVSD